jgi:hypothetical protein
MGENPKVYMNKHEMRQTEKEHKKHLVGKTYNSRSQPFKFLRMRHRNLYTRL